MIIISSAGTVFTKKIFPALWLGFVAIFFAASSVSAFAGVKGNAWPLLVVPALMMIFGFILFRKLVWNLADEVRDAGDSLVVRKGAVEQRVPLANIINVSMNQFTNPRRLTLRLRTPCGFGDEIAFIPKTPVFQWNPFARNAIAEDLIRRVDQARRGGRS